MVQSIDRTYSNNVKNCPPATRELEKQKETIKLSQNLWLQEVVIAIRSGEMKGVADYLKWDH